MYTKVMVRLKKFTLKFNNNECPKILRSCEVIPRRIPGGTEGGWVGMYQKIRRVCKEKRRL